MGEEGREKQTGGWVGTRRRGGALAPSLDDGSRAGKDTGSAEVLLLAGAVDLGVSGGTAAGFGAWGLELELLLGNV